MRECKSKRRRLRKNIAMSAVESIKNTMVKAKVEVEEKINILGEKSEECVTVIEKAAKKSFVEMEEKFSLLGERSGECVNLIERVAKKSVGHLRATLYTQTKGVESIDTKREETETEESTSNAKDTSTESNIIESS